MSFRYVLAFSCCAALVPFGCKKSSAPVEAAAPATASAPSSAPPSLETPIEPVELIHLRGSIAHIDDMLEAWTRLAERFEATPSEGDAKTKLQAILLSTGFGPAMLNHLDLVNPHAVALDMPQAGQDAAGNRDLSVHLAATNARGLIESLPPSLRPNALGEGLWELRMQDERFLLRERPRAVLIGIDTPDLDRAERLPTEEASKRRMQLRAWNIGRDAIDPSALLDMELGSARQAFDRVIRRATAADLGFDFGTTLDTALVLGVDAPWSELGLSPIGPSRATPTAIEALLPAQPVFALSLSWGDPKLLHETLDRTLNANEIPDPVGAIVRAALAHVHALLDQVKNDVTLALYLDEREQAAIVIAADIRDPLAAKTALRGLSGIAKDAALAQAALTGNAKNSALQATFKTDGVKLASRRADQLSVTLPKDIASAPDLAPWQVLLQKNKFEVLTLVDDGVAVALLGAGARSTGTRIAANLGKAASTGGSGAATAGGTSLGSDAGLAILRLTMGGCQACGIVDETALLRLLLAVQSSNATTANKARAKKLLTSLRGVDIDGSVGFGLSIQPTRAATAMTAPKNYVNGSIATARKLADAIAFLTAPADAPSP